MKKKVYYRVEYQKKENTDCGSIPFNKLEDASVKFDEFVNENIYKLVKIIRCSLIDKSNVETIKEFKI